MSENPYQSPAAAGARRKTRGTRWAIWSGIACLVISAVCTVLTVAGMMASFQTVGSSSPQAVATGIGGAMIPAYGIFPFGLAGIILVIAGIVIRRPISE